MNVEAPHAPAAGLARGAASPDGGRVQAGGERAAREGVRMGATPKSPRIIGDVLARVPGYVFQVILDVGANTGQSCLPFAAALPEARILAFEPVRATYRTLRRNVAGHPSITTFNLALGRQSGEARISSAANAPTNRLLAAEVTDGQIVTVRTGRQLLRREGIERVSFLKVDTEGHDLDVVRGFGDDLERIDFIQVEAGMNRYNRTQVPWRAFADFFDAAGFALFHIYGQAFEFKQGGRPVLRRGNMVFINPRLIGDLSQIT